MKEFTSWKDEEVKDLFNLATTQKNMQEKEILLEIIIIKN